MKNKSTISLELPKYTIGPIKIFRNFLKYFLLPFSFFPMINESTWYIAYFTVPVAVVGLALDYILYGGRQIVLIDKLKQALIIRKKGKDDKIFNLNTVTKVLARYYISPIDSNKNPNHFELAFENYDGSIQILFDDKIVWVSIEVWEKFYKDLAWIIRKPLELVNYYEDSNHQIKKEEKQFIKL